MDEERIDGETGLQNDIDELFKSSLTEFVSARNKLAARLKQDGRLSDANLVKALSKPSISAWAVNQLYWKHREAFDRLLVTRETRREALSHLLDLATALLRDAGHNAAPDTIHRITSTLEAISAYAMLSDGPTPGRLTQDLEPPGFESLASLLPVRGTTERRKEPATITPSQKSFRAETKLRPMASPGDEAQEAHQREEKYRAGIAAANTSLEQAKRSLAEARSRAHALEAQQKKASAEAKRIDAEARLAEKQLHLAQERFNKAIAASQDAAHRAQRIAAEEKEAAKALEEAMRAVERASKELESRAR